MSKTGTTRVTGNPVTHCPEARLTGRSSTP